MTRRNSPARALRDPDPDQTISFAEFLSSQAPLEARISSVLRDVDRILSTLEPAAFLNSALDSVSTKTRKLTTQSIACADHVGFIVPAETKISMLERVSRAGGFNGDHQTVSSVVVARELSKLLGTVVPTTIFRCVSGRLDDSVGAEVFIPSAHPKFVNQWIRDGVGTHIAFRLKPNASIEELRGLLTAEGLKMPEFMGGRPMENKNDGTLTVYFDLPLKPNPLRIEFFHRKN